jgi:hypothetical protein
MEGAEENLTNIQELLKNAVFLRQQIKYEEARRYVLHILSVWMWWALILRFLCVTAFMILP